MIFLKTANQMVLNRIRNFQMLVGDRMTNYTVHVCGNATLADADNSCHICGSFGAVDDGKWGTVQCGTGDGIQGNFVEIHSDGNALQIAEIEIYGSEKL